MQRTEIVDQLTEIFRKLLSEKSLVFNDEMTLNDVDNWDSLSHMLLIREIENYFSVKEKLRVLNKMNNVRVLIDIIKKRLN